MTPRLLPAGRRVGVPWKNGGGITREVLAGFEGGGGFDWRVSLAEVAGDGPFSVFPGVDRILTLAEGDGMDLTVGGRRWRVGERFVPLAFPGDTPTDCALLGGPVVNLNVMCRRDRAAARVEVVRGRLTDPVRITAPAAGETVLVVALEGAAALGDLDLGPYDAVLLGPGEEPARLRTEGRAAVVVLRAL
ncbi:HutD/Ves family protein [Streptomyces liangshanensis]|uniref:HutD family protein n=1 Tax=Streptomyces liangshanensis TaxID=2717324 RepID=A0A6G9H420_9ACTN|nr:HutD family protein [Streptomyces liangshanensis]QIQ05265.1 HutD family protein [Streptomyces liangshanensis]